MKYILAHDTARRLALDAVANAPVGFAVTVKPPARTLDQNAKFHAVVASINGLPWAGKPRSADDWKTLMVSGHAVATGGASEVIPGLEGEFVNIRESTATMSKARSSSLIDYAMAWIANTEMKSTA